MPIHFQLADYAAPGALLSIDRAMARLERADPVEMRAYQAGRLREVLGRAQAASAHWRRVFEEANFDPRGLEDPAHLRSLPILTKDELRRAGDEMLDPNARDLRWASTSGTSGQPVRVAMDRRARALEFCYYRRAWSWGGYRLGAAFAELGSYHFLRAGGEPERLVEWQPFLRRLLVNSSRVAPERMPEIRQALLRHRPRFIKGLPTALQHLVRCGEISGVGVPSMRAAFSGGEIVTSRARGRIEVGFACPLLDSYGHMERTVAASQCTEGRYHVHGAYGVFETTDFERRADGTLIANVYGTGLHNLAQPLVRYETEDRVVLDAQNTRCPCGRTLRTLRSIEGRCSHVITAPDGRSLPGLPMVFDDIDGIEVLQLVQVAPDAVVLHVVPGARWSSAALGELENAAARGLGSNMRFEVRVVEPDGLLRRATGKVLPVSALDGLTDQDSSSS
ncbi:Phenylacetate-coenzyme A ligase [Planctomycetes bacterium Poly30]|uniref:Phenylacetate-coenzyme A ligase n=1 Tax=Saltatorellus ferox TaxID=2528018 RepID=A0A518EYL1_9BACT|nr:Phenylacetate-coenzyme A ligase [Planctomycetes bacterium Poly30]